MHVQMQGLLKLHVFCSVYCAEDTFDGMFSPTSAAASLDAHAKTGGASRARDQKARAHGNNQNAHKQNTRKQTGAASQRRDQKARARPHNQRSHVRNADVQTARASHGSDQRASHGSHQRADAQPSRPQNVQKPPVLLETSAEASTSASAMMTVLGLYDYVPGVGRDGVGKCWDAIIS